MRCLLRVCPLKQNIFLLTVVYGRPAVLSIDKFGGSAIMTSKSNNLFCGGREEGFKVMVCF